MVCGMVSKAGIAGLMIIGYHSVAGLRNDAVGQKSERK